MKNLILILVAIIFLFGNFLFAQDTTLVAGEKNIFYGEASSILFMSGLTANYERVLNKHFGVRTGYSAGYTIVGGGHGGLGFGVGHGPLAAINFFTALRPQKLEICAGASYVTVENLGWKFYPVFSVSYRYQKQDETFWRFGIDGFVFGGLQMSAGYFF